MPVEPTQSEGRHHFDKLRASSDRSRSSGAANDAAHSGPEPAHPAISVIIPARNEEANLGSCIASLIPQTGVAFEIIVVDDHSTDRTRDIALSFAGVRVLEARALPSGWTGKNNAVTTGALAALGKWLLFTDADTVHLPGSLSGAWQEAQNQGAALLSYSPEQIVKGFWERAVMPVVFAELASCYRPQEVSDPRSPAAAANGQYLLISREAYDAVGGHAGVASSLLEDVALAQSVKRSGRKILFRYGGDAVRTRMYRSFAQLQEGWTKNLALLFPWPGWLAAWRVLEFVLLVSCVFFGIVALTARDYLHVLLYAILPIVTLTRIRRANFPWGANLLAFAGLPVFAYLLLRSKIFHARGAVSWKGRSYAGSARESADASKLPKAASSPTQARKAESRG